MSLRSTVSLLCLTLLPATTLAHHGGEHAAASPLLWGLGALGVAAIALLFRSRKAAQGASFARAPALPTVQAHCDVPCGIYDPSHAQIAAMSVARFLDQIAEMGEPKDWGVEQWSRLSRLTEQKESHAAVVKSEIVVIWGDSFRSPQFDEHPELHELTHEILRTASSCKQETHQENGPKLVELVNRFAEIFWVTKGVETRRVTAPYKPNLPVVQPVLAAAE